MKSESPAFRPGSVQFGFGTVDAQPQSDDLLKLSDSELRELCFLKPNGKTDVKIWLAANEEARRRDHLNFQSEFRNKGWPYRWFLDTKPLNKAQDRTFEVLDEAYEVVRKYYPSIVERGIDRPEDIGLLQNSGRQSSEGVRVKREPYGHLIHIQILCVLGPTNFDPADGTVEFEPGAKSHLLHLAYEDLPSSERLMGDVLAHPIITHPSNCIPGRTYRSEGFVSSKLAREGLPCHRPWDTLSPDEVARLSRLSW